MKEKYQSKYLQKEDSAASKKKKTTVLIAVLVCAVVVAAAGGVWYFRGTSGNGEPENTAAPTASQINAETQIQYSVIETAYGLLQFDKEYADQIRHEEISENGLTMEVFYMLLENSELELFRICFGDTAMGNPIGKIQTYGKEAPVSVMVNSYGESDFPDQKTLYRYYALMEQLNVVVDSLRAFDTFLDSTSQTGMESAMQQVKLTYWDVALPENILWEESDADGVYRVDFYGLIGEERIRLYTVSLGDADLSSALGMYETDAGRVPVSVKTYTLASQGEWNDDVHTTAYAVMMESVNDVIQAVTSDKRFVDQMP